MVEHIYLISMQNNKFEKIKVKKRSDIISLLYFLKYRLPSEKEVDLLKNDKRSDRIVKEAKRYYNKTSLSDVKIYISDINDNIPLFNIYHVNIYLINRDNVYYRSVYGSYRFPGEGITKYFKKYLKDTKDEESDMVTKRKHRKIKLMTNFLNQLDIDELYKSYIRVFTKYSPQIGNLITECHKPSFMSAFTHLTPYYTRKELINLALNMKLDLKFDIYDPDNLSKICETVSMNDINYKILLSHQRYIVENSAVGMIKYYTIQGSYFMNQYLRELTPYENKNKMMENNIKKIWKLILNAPQFDNDYYIYRFIENDEFISHLKVGDHFIENGFMSTTRDPFYRSDIYKFGFILMKIKIPKGKRGVALCLETLSQFPHEQEIILPPRCKFKLVSKNKNCEYHHVDSDYAQKIRVRYEFEWLENLPIKFDRNLDEKSHLSVDFMKISDQTTVSLKEKVRIFTSRYMNTMSQFYAKIGKQQFKLIGEWYNSTGAYKPFYAVEVPDGFSIYTIFDGNILFMIELADKNDDRIMMVNYYLRYTNINRSKLIPESDFIDFLCGLAHYFDISNVLIYSDFISCDEPRTNVTNVTVKQREFSANFYESSNEKNKKVTENDKNMGRNILSDIYGGYHSLDIYNYLKHGKKRFSDIDVKREELSPYYSYDDLDTLRTISPQKILKKEDNDELFQIYLRNYLPHMKGDDSIRNFYLWIVDNYCYLISVLVEKMSRVYIAGNPFEKIVYTLHPDIYLYNRGIIDHITESMAVSYPIKKVYSSNINSYRDMVDKAKKIDLF